MQKTTDLRLATFVAALASLGAGVIHLAVAPSHWQAWIIYGVFFLGIALFQLLWAGLVLRFPRSGIVGLGLAANLASMALWGASRVWGPPVGPGAGVPEPVGVPGVLTVLLEALTVISALWLLLPRQQMAVLTTGAYRVALGGAVLAVATLTAPGAVAALGHDHGSQGHGSHGGQGHGTHGASETHQTPKRDHQRNTPAPCASSTDPTPTPSPTESADTGGHDDGHSH